MRFTNEHPTTVALVSIILAPAILIGVPTLFFALCTFIASLIP